MDGLCQTCFVLTASKTFWPEVQVLITERQKTLLYTFLKSLISLNIFYLHSLQKNIDLFTRILRMRNLSKKGKIDYLWFKKACCTKLEFMPAPSPKLKDKFQLNDLRVLWFLKFLFSKFFIVDQCSPRLTFPQQNISARQIQNCGQNYGQIHSP